MYPKLRFYLITKKPEGMTEEELYERELVALTSYHETYGKDGFGSERTYASELPRMARQRAQQKFKLGKECKYAVETIAVEDAEDEALKIAELEKVDGFYRMVEEKEVKP